MDGFPDRYEILPNPLNRLKKIASKLGHISGRPQASVIYLSEHYTPEPTDGEALQPQLPFTPLTQEKARQVAHYVLMAEQAKYENRI
jgi:hypothetical protein